MKISVFSFSFFVVLNAFVQTHASIVCHSGLAYAGEVQQRSLYRLHTWYWLKEMLYIMRFTVTVLLKNMSQHHKSPLPYRNGKSWLVITLAFPTIVVILCHSPFNLGYREGV